jgi:hypothetical protein
VRGADLIVARISSGGSRKKGKPMFKMVGNMHGDETLGRQLILYMAEYLAKNYRQDEGGEIK